MGRTQAFDTVTVVRAARRLFWAQGFESTSIPDLEAATGLNRSSIYHAFGSKRGLFDAAVDSYLTEIIRPRLRDLQSPSVEPEALGNYLEGLSTALRDRRSTLATDGCLLVNAAGAEVSRDDEVRRVIADYRAELSSAISRGFAARHPDRSPADREHATRSITALVVSALALTRADPAAALENLETAGLLAE